MRKTLNLEGTDVTVYSIGEVEWFYNYRLRKTKGSKNKLGYRRVGINGKFYQVHRLVALAFLPNPDNLPEVDHIVPVSEGGTNDVSNLRWCSHKENQNNPLSREKMSNSKTYNKNASKPIIATNKTTGEVREFLSAREADKALGISYKAISNCLRGKSNSAGGGHFEYKNPLS